MLYHLLGRKIVHIANGPSVGRMEGVWVNSLGISRAEGGQPAGGSRGGAPWGGGVLPSDKRKNGSQVFVVSFFKMYTLLI